MKKFILVAFLCAINFFSIAQAYNRHGSTITIGYGIKNLWTVFLDKVVDIPEYKVRSSGPYSLIYEHSVFKRMSAGLAASYSRVRGKAERFQLADQITFLSLIARANYHLFNGEKMDPYFGAGIGVNNSKYKNLDTHTIISNANSNVPNTVDFSFQLGFKYFFNNQFAINGEAGYISGAVGLVGLSAKF